MRRYVWNTNVYNVCMYTYQFIFLDVNVLWVGADLRGLPRGLISRQGPAPGFDEAWFPSPVVKEATNSPLPST